MPIIKKKEHNKEKKSDIKFYIDCSKPKEDKVS